MAGIQPKHTSPEISGLSLLHIDPTELDIRTYSSFDCWLASNRQFHWAGTDISEDEPSKLMR